MSIKSELNIIASNVLSKVRATGDKESTLSLTKLANNFGLELSLSRDNHKALESYRIRANGDAICSECDGDEGADFYASGQEEV